MYFAFSVPSRPCGCPRDSLIGQSLSYRGILLATKAIEACRRCFGIDAYLGMSSMPPALITSEKPACLRSRAAWALLAPEAQ